MFTWKEFRAALIVAGALISGGITYVARCEIQFAKLQAELDQCKANQQRADAPKVKYVQPN